MQEERPRGDAASSSRAAAASSSMPSLPTLGSLTTVGSIMKPAFKGKANKLTDSKDDRTDEDRLPASAPPPHLPPAAPVPRRVCVSPKVLRLGQRRREGTPVGIGVGEARRAPGVTPNLLCAHKAGGVCVRLLLT